MPFYEPTLIPSIEPTLLRVDTESDDSFDTHAARAVEHATSNPVMSSLIGVMVILFCVAICVGCVAVRVCVRCKRRRLNDEINLAAAKQEYQHRDAAHDVSNSVINIEMSEDEKEVEEEEEDEEVKEEDEESEGLDMYAQYPAAPPVTVSTSTARKESRMEGVIKRNSKHSQHNSSSVEDDAANRGTTPASEDSINDACVAHPLSPIRQQSSSSNSFNSDGCDTGRTSGRTTGRTADEDNLCNV